MVISLGEILFWYYFFASLYVCVYEYLSQFTKRSVIRLRRIIIRGAVLVKPLRTVFVAPGQSYNHFFFFFCKYFYFIFFFYLYTLQPLRNKQQSPFVRRRMRVFRLGGPSLPSTKVCFVWRLKRDFRSSAAGAYCENFRTVKTTTGDARQPAATSETGRFSSPFSQQTTPPINHNNSNSIRNNNSTRPADPTPRQAPETTQEYEEFHETTAKSTENPLNRPDASPVKTIPVEEILTLVLPNESHFLIAYLTAS